MLESNPRIFVEKSTFETSRRIRGRNHTLLVSFVRLVHEAEHTDGMHCGFLAGDQYGTYCRSPCSPLTIVISSSAPLQVSIGLRPRLSTHEL